MPRFAVRPNLREKSQARRVHRERVSVAQALELLGPEWQNLRRDIEEAEYEG